MYVHDFKAGWLGHPFLTSRLKIRDEKQIRRVLEHGLKFLYIDTDKGLDVPDAPTQQEVFEEIETELDQMSFAAPTQPPKRVEIHEELDIAARVKDEARSFVSSLMEEVRLGKQVHVEKAESLVSNMIDSILRNQNALISLSGIRTKDEYTFMHSVGVCALMVSFTSSAGVDRDITSKAGVGALLHDMGKVKTPENILNCQGKLTDREFGIMKEHVVHSRELMMAVDGIDAVSITMAGEHHERWDGSGYPAGLKNGQISKLGQMIAIVDVYDAMTSDRCYQKGMQPAEVVRRLYEWSQFHFPREIVEEFIKCVGIYPVGTLVRLESGLLGFVTDLLSENLLLPVVRVVFDTRKNWRVTPYDMNLAEKNEKGLADRIVTHETPEKWGLKASTYLEQFQTAV